MQSSVSRECFRSEVINTGPCLAFWPCCGERVNQRPPLCLAKIWPVRRKTFKKNNPMWRLREISIPAALRSALIPECVHGWERNVCFCACVSASVSIHRKRRMRLYVHAYVHWDNVEYCQGTSMAHSVCVCMWVYVCASSDHMLFAVFLLGVMEYCVGSPVCIHHIDW